MAGGDGRLQEVLEGYAVFLREKELALAKHRPHMVRWVREFLLFARRHGGYTFGQTLDLFLAEAGARVGTKPWQLQQASDAIRISPREIDRLRLRQPSQRRDRRPASGRREQSDRQLRQPFRYRSTDNETGSTVLPIPIRTPPSPTP